jgi:hypothetical protein
MEKIDGAEADLLRTGRERTDREKIGRAHAGFLPIGSARFIG